MSENYVMPPKGRKALDGHRARADRKVYLVVGAKDSEAWKRCKKSLGDYAAAEHYCATKKADVKDLLNKTGKLGWPEGTQWAGGTPAAVCFGWQADPVFYLTEEQAKDRITVKAAYRAAREKTKVGASR